MHRQQDRIDFARTKRVLGAHREAVHVRAVEPRYISRRAHIDRENALVRAGECDDFGFKRRKFEMFAKPAQCLIPVDYGQELLLLK